MFNKNLAALVLFASTAVCAQNTVVPIDPTDAATRCAAIAGQYDRMGFESCMAGQGIQSPNPKELAERNNALACKATAADAYSLETCLKNRNVRPETANAVKAATPAP